ncbi:MAG: hypothetical protein FWH06_03440 [Oscillospiraceae bacterium]|nr:hypothetical protein [Oscillospiraceae bacterium]
MSEKRKMSNEEVCAKLTVKGAGRQAEKVELTDDQLDAVAGGVGAYAFENTDGTVAMAMCDKKETDNALFQSCLLYTMKCPYASMDATSCYDCAHLSVWGTPQTVK